MVERDIYLILTGGFIGLVSSLATIYLTYVLDGLRMRRRWEREDALEMKTKRAELEQLLQVAGNKSTSEPGLEDLAEHPPASAADLVDDSSASSDPQFGKTQNLGTRG